MSESGSGVRRCRQCSAPLPEELAFCSKCGTAAAAPASGDPLLEKLRALFGPELQFERELGRGGMAVVYAAYDPGLQRRVAVKALLPELAAEAGMTERFLREARTVAALHHPHVVSVYSVRANVDAQAIVMQYVDGRSLDALLKERSPLPLHVAGMILSQVADGLQHAHDRGVVHRDVKPANVLLDREGRAVVSDFGIARREDAPRVTATGMVIGTWAYMSPEQRRGQPTTAATDQYAFGVMAFELLAGRLPFTGTAVEILRAHLADPPPSLREQRAEVSAGVEALIHRMLAKTPEERLPSLREAQQILRTLVTDGQATTQVLAALSQVRSAATVPARFPATTPGTAKPAGRTAAEEDSVATERYEGGSQRFPTVVAPRSAVPRWALAAGLVVSVLAAGGLWVARSGSLAGTATVAAPPASAPVSSPSSGVTPEVGPAGGAAPLEGAAAAVAPGTRSAPAGFPAQGPDGANGTKDVNAGIDAPSRPVAARTDSAPPTAPSAPKQPSGPQVLAQEAPVPATVAAVASTGAAATLADARRVAREFVTMLNQRRYRDVAQLTPESGDAALREELVRLTQSAADFEAGFDRVASAPEATPAGFTTEFTLDLAWRGGKKLLLVQAHATMQNDAWHLTGIGVVAAP